MNDIVPVFQALPLGHRVAATAESPVAGAGLLQYSEGMRSALRPLQTCLLAGALALPANVAEAEETRL